MNLAGSLSLALLLSVALVLGCAGAERTEAQEPAEASASDEAPTEEGKEWGGWRWKGKRDDCFFLFENRCFDALEAACEAAGCGAGRSCVHDDAAPAVVTCEAK